MEKARKGKVVGICGSPRKGNTEFLLEVALSTAKKAGAETELILLRNRFIQKNNPAEFNELVDATAIILGSPSYEHNVTDLMKKFMESVKPLAEGGFLENKKGGVIAVGSQSLKSIKSAATVMEEFLESNGVNLEKTITIIAEKPDDARKQKDAIGAAMELGKIMVGE